MAKYNKATWASRFSDFINRAFPFNGNALIQKSELDTVVGTDLGDSVIFGQPSTSTITDPSAAFNINFNTIDRYTVNTATSGTDAFNITLQNLDENRTGLISITKKAGDTFSFVNGTLIPFDNTIDQAGKTNISFIVKIINGSYFVEQAFQAKFVRNLASLGELKQTVVDIGDWNMDTSASVFVVHGITDGDLVIRGVQVMIRSDTGSLSDLNGNDLNFNNEGGVQSITSLGITLNRLGGGRYDNAAYDSTGYNRGWILITYQE